MSKVAPTADAETPPPPRPRHRVCSVATEVRVVVLINYNSIKADRGKGVRDLIKILRDLFGDAERLLASMASVVVGVSRAPLKDEDDEFVLSADVIEQLCNPSGFEEAQQKVLEKIQKGAFLFHPLDRGHESWDTRTQLLERINALPPITDPAAVFKVGRARFRSSVWCSPGVSCEIRADLRLDWCSLCVMRVVCCLHRRCSTSRTSRC